ncbi:hypothetical protein TNCV_710531 [Trichonephila clavipes]|nr:hypothetical protein TNCV_710531 [Trichonephila clavipes]
MMDGVEMLFSEESRFCLGQNACNLGLHLGSHGHLKHTNCKSIHLSDNSTYSTAIHEQHSREFSNPITLALKPLW